MQLSYWYGERNADDTKSGVTPVSPPTRAKTWPAWVARSSARLRPAQVYRVSFHCTKVQSTGTDADFYAEYCDFASVRLETDAS